MTSQILHYAVYVWACVLTLFLPWFLASYDHFDSVSSGSSSSKCPVFEFHGGSPSGFGAGLGSCYCGSDTYCLCTPSLAIDAIVEVNSRYASSPTNDIGILLVVRRDSYKKKYAIPGGFVNVGETVENAVLREVHEETNVVLDEASIFQFKTVSDPKRDHRRHTVSVVFRCITDTIFVTPPPSSSSSHNTSSSISTSGSGGGKPAVLMLGKQQLRGGDDAKAVEIVPLRSVLNLDLAFDHKAILQSYIEQYHPSLRVDREVVQHIIDSQ
jgi:ADP-ribose pyrophosphatase YjhB (NUDIX family)